jgi:hypothetical protein
MKTPLNLQFGSHTLFALLLATVAAGAVACSTTTSPPNNVVVGTGGKKGAGTGGNIVTGSGGTTGAGVGGNTGTPPGGSGGMGVVQKLCATKTTLMQPVLINFESYDGTVAANNFGTAFGGAAPNVGTAYTGPFAYPEDATTLAPTLSILAGHPPSQWAVSETSMGARVWGMGGGIWMSCANASAYKGISFWVRGSGPLNVMSFSLDMQSTVMPDVNNAAGGGTCPGTKETCLPAKKADIPLTADWTQVQILWADFAPGMSGGTAVIPNGDNITGLGWSVPLQFTLSPSAMGDAAGPYMAVPGDLVINIDDVSFIP